MLRLEDREWKAFTIHDIFSHFIRGKVSSVSDRTRIMDGVPYIGATDRNNGVLDFLEYDPKVVQTGNCIVFICDGQGSVGSSVYMPASFIGTVNITAGYASWINKYTGLFVSTVSNMVRTKYSFGYKRKYERLVAEKLMLPMTKTGEPDYQFMEDYVREIIGNKLQRWNGYVNCKEI